MSIVLVLCTGNSCRSQMMHGYLAHYAPQSSIYSAGIQTHGVNPYAVKSMQNDDIDISHHTSNHINEYTHIPFTHIITVCDHALENCPYFPSNAQQFHHNFTDPAKAVGTEKAIIQSFATVRDDIKKYAQAFVHTYLIS